MPLDHSSGRAAFEHNVKAEHKAGKDPKQALAIAYSVARHAKGKKHTTAGEMMAGMKK